jgi:hypothetical protein
MDDKADKPKRRWPTYLAVVLVLLLIVYPLSIGPAAVAMYRLKSDAFITVMGICYKPVVLSASTTPQTENMLDEYVTWWCKVTNTYPWS